MKKNRKRNNNSKVLGLVIALFTIICAIIMLVIVLISQKEKEQPQNTIAEDQAVMQEIKEEYKNSKKQLVPDHYNILTRLYEGTVKSEEVYQKLYIIVYETIPEIQKELGTNPSQEEIKQYYKKNKEKIQKQTGIEDQEEYVEFAQYICNQKATDYQNAILEVDQYQEKNNKEAQIPVTLIYQNTTLTLELQLQENNPRIKIQV